jgi:hypothetical protein
MHIEMMRPLVLWYFPCKPNQLLMADKIFMKNDKKEEEMISSFKQKAHVILMELVITPILVNSSLVASLPLRSFQTIT